MWNATQARYLNQEFESIYCWVTNQTFVNLLSQWTTFPICYTKTNFSCGPDASYLGGECRW